MYPTNAVSKLVPKLRLDSIRNQILAFAVLATLIPSLSTTWLSYSQNKRSLEEKITSELQTVSAETERELDLWLKERLYDLRVFASSYEVTENLDRATRNESAGLHRLNDYLNSVRDRFTDYEQLLVVDRQGHVVATSTASSSSVTMPDGWISDLNNGNPAIGTPYWDQSRGRVVLVTAVPIRMANGRLLGALTAKLNLHSVDDILKRFTPGPADALYVIQPDGRVITSSRAGSKQPMRTSLGSGTVRTLLAREGTTVHYAGLDQIRVVGSLRSVQRLNWSVIAELPVSEAYDQVIRLRNATILIMTALLLGVGLIAYGLGLLIVRPLNRLAHAAGKIAGGDLTVDLPPVRGRGEVAYLTEVFNDMVVRLRQGRDALARKTEELEQLSITDGLTKLYNRRYLMDRLTAEILRCRRHKRVFTVLMADVDHFKPYNDARGHLAGDDALARVGAVLRSTTREDDCAARYGGEEFVIVLAETAPEGAMDVCERIRTRLAGESFDGSPITLSIGLAGFPEHGDTPEAIISAADDAMYQAKRDGRNRVAQATKKRSRVAKKQA